MGYVKNLTAHYRQLLDQVLEERSDLRPASSGRCTYSFTPDPDRNFNRESTDYFVNGRQDDIGAFDTPKHAGLPLGHVLRVGADHFDVTLDETTLELNNGDGLTYFDLQKELVGVQVNTAQLLNAATRTWRVVPNEAITAYKDLRRDVPLSRNRDMAWDRVLGRKSAERRIGVSLHLEETPTGFALAMTDENGHVGRAAVAHAKQPAQNEARAEPMLREHLGKLGNTVFEPREITLQWSRPWFLPAGVVNALRREATEHLEAARATALGRLPRAHPVEPPVPYPEDTLSYLANVLNHKAQEFYTRHGVKVVAAAYESHEEMGEVSLMITKHCVRWSMSLCPKQAKGVTGVQGTVRAEPLTLINGSEKLTLRFDCKPCEMHVVGKIKRAVLNQVQAAPLQFYKRRPATASSS
jgi:putative protease